MDDGVKTVLKEEVLSILGAYGGASAVRETLDQLIEDEDDVIYGRMLWMMAALRMDAAPAKAVWGQVVDHRDELEEGLGR